MYVNFNWRGHSRHAFKARREAMVDLGLSRMGGCEGIHVVHDEEGTVGRDELWGRYGTYAFGISPRGNGIDSHRTWEMLWFGMIPVVKSGPLDEMYEGLPVLIVGEWKELCTADLEGIRKAMEPRWEVVGREDFFTVEYWMERGLRGKGMGGDMKVMEPEYYANGGGKGGVDPVQPEVYLMALPREREVGYVRRTREALGKLNYTWMEYESVDGNTEVGKGRIKDVERRWNVGFKMR